MSGLRWSCPVCGRFIAESSIVETCYRDPGAYYGVGTRTEATCTRCGVIDAVRMSAWDDGPGGAE